MMWKNVSQEEDDYILCSEYSLLLTDFRLNDFKIPLVVLASFDPWLVISLTVIWSFHYQCGQFNWWIRWFASGVSIISSSDNGDCSFFLPVPNLFLDHDHFCFSCSNRWIFPLTTIQPFFYLGDTGALFIGFMISVLPLQGLENATAAAVVTPMIILGVPITNTCIIRRTLSGQKFTNRIAITYITVCFL